MKKFLSLFLALALTLMLSPFAFAEESGITSDLLDSFVHVITSSLVRGYGEDNVESYYDADSNSIHIFIAINGFSDALTDYANSNGLLNKNFIYSTRDSLVALSGVLHVLAVSAGLSDTQIYLYLMNDKDLDRCFFSILDGKFTLDGLTELEDSFSEEAPSPTPSSSQPQTQVESILDSGSSSASGLSSPLEIYNASGITATLISLSYGRGKDLNATFHVENTSEHEIYFELDGCVLDGASFPLTMYWYTVSAGTSCDCDLALDSSDIAKYGIDELHQAKFKISIYDTVAEYTMDEFWSDDIIIDGSDYTFPLSVDSYECVYDRDGIQLYNLGVIGNDACVLVYNGRDSDVMLSPLSVSFDGVMDPDFVSWGQYVFSHTYYILPIECDGGISSMTTAKFSIWVYSSEYGTNTFLYETDPIDLTLK